MSVALSMLIALATDAAIGWPDGLYRRIGHPVSWIGKAIDFADRSFNDESGRGTHMAGAAVAGVIVFGSAGLAHLVEQAIPSGWAHTMIVGTLAWPFFAVRSLHDHVAAVADPLAKGDLAAARRAVAAIVGRDPDQLDKAGVARASLESLAENTSDGIVAPLFWALLLGLPGLVAYKALNTLDSMIGHRTPRYEAFGWASARFDDFANLVPARITGALFALVSQRRGTAFAVMRRYASQHRSPNAGWPEAALAGALGVRLSGPRVYHDHVSDEPWLNGAAPDPTPADVTRGLALYRRLIALLFVFLALWAAMF
ncbi:MAG: cobalamin biosynthesis protein CobD [Hyphomicrobiales bacterium]|nr:MAG: cobalamin biosynthesis protein CobD [Hyphomicrobiales bacterium]